MTTIRLISDPTMEPGTWELRQPRMMVGPTSPAHAENEGCSIVGCTPVEDKEQA